MINAKLSDEFKRILVHQIGVCGYAVAKASQRLDVSSHSLYGWVMKFAKQEQCSSDDERGLEIRRLKLKLM